MELTKLLGLIGQRKRNESQNSQHRHRHRHPSSPLPQPSPPNLKIANRTSSRPSGIQWSPAQGMDAGQDAGQGGWRRADRSSGTQTEPSFTGVSRAGQGRQTLNGVRTDTWTDFHGVHTENHTGAQVDRLSVRSRQPAAADPNRNRLSQSLVEE